MDSLSKHVVWRHWQKQEDQKKNQSYLWTAVAGAWNQGQTMQRDMLIHKTSEMIQLWTDLTMMYQGDFKPLHDLYRDMRQKHVPFPSTRDKKYFDDLR